MRQQESSQRRLMAIPSPWFDLGPRQEAEEQEEQVPDKLPSPEEVAAVRSRCEAMYAEQVQVRLLLSLFWLFSFVLIEMQQKKQIFHAHQAKNKRGDSYFAATVMKQGTLSDKMASTAIQVIFFFFFFFAFFSDRILFCADSRRSLLQSRSSSIFGFVFSEKGSS